MLVIQNKVSSLYRSFNINDPEKGREVVCFIIAVLFWLYLSSEYVFSSTLSLKGVDDIDCDDSLSLSVLGLEHLRFIWDQNLQEEYWTLYQMSTLPVISKIILLSMLDL